MKRHILLALVAIAGIAGCVSVDDTKVQVIPPGTADQYQRNVLDKCDPHVYPHRLILGTTGQGSALMLQGPAVANDQTTFDTYWNSISPSLDENKVPSFSGKPLINFDSETAYFFPIVISNSCQKFKPYGDEMTTDCYNISLVIYRYTDTVDCQPVNTFPVFIYIYPKTNWPLGIQWIDPTATPTPIASATMSPTMTPTATATPAGVNP